METLILFKYSNLVVNYTGTSIEGRTQTHGMLKSFISSYSIQLSHVREVFLMISLSCQTYLTPGEQITEYSALLLHDCHIANTTVACRMTQNNSCFTVLFNLLCDGQVKHIVTSLFLFVVCSIFEHR